MDDTMKEVGSCGWEVEGGFFGGGEAVRVERDVNPGCGRTFILLIVVGSVIVGFEIVAVGIERWSCESAPIAARSTSKV